MPRVPIGSRVGITFTGDQPVSVALSDELVATTGVPRYAAPPVVTSLTKRADSYECELGINEAAYLSSNSDSYLPGATFRGFTLIAHFGTVSRVYVFAIRTDAG
jgi:hypothetical protein